MLLHPQQLSWKLPVLAVFSSLLLNLFEERFSLVSEPNIIAKVLWRVSPVTPTFPNKNDSCRSFTDYPSFLTVCLTCPLYVILCISHHFFSDSFLCGLLYLLPQTFSLWTLSSFLLSFHYEISPRHTDLNIIYRLMTHTFPYQLLITPLGYQLDNPIACLPGTSKLTYAKLSYQTCHSFNFQHLYQW